jgi:hypothetical protein
MIDIDENKNPEVYYNLEKGVEFSRNIQDKNLDQSVNFHAFWKGSFGRKQALPIKSFFATQDTKLATFNLWSTEDLSQNEFLKPFKDKIVFKDWNPLEEARGTLLEGSPFLSATDNRCWVDGDLFRLLVLHKYGGVYVDMDIVLLRNFAPLLDQEFMYKWGTEKNMINGALMHLKQKSVLSTHLLTELSKRSPVPNTTVWGNDVYTAVREHNKDWTVFPAAMFDTEWQISPKDLPKYGFYDGILHPFKNCDQSKFLFEGAFSWHWHGRWNETIEEGSKWHTFEVLTNQALQNEGVLI